MAFINPAQATGDIVKMARTNPLHLAGIGEASAPKQDGGVEGQFGQMLMSALGGVSDSQTTAMDLSQKMITDPSTVNVEDVTIAMAQANLALSMTKAIVDRALAAYREIINIR